MTNKLTYFNPNIKDFNQEVHVSMQPRYTGMLKSYVSKIESLESVNEQLTKELDEIHTTLRETLRLLAEANEVA
jgi:hypothetical protein